MKSRTWILALLCVALFGCGPKWPGDPRPPDPNPPPPGPPVILDFDAIVGQTPGLRVHTDYNAYGETPSAWFAEPRPARYCILAPSEALANVESASADAAAVWKDYVTRRRVLEALTARARESGVDFKGLSLDLVPVDCAADPDLTIEVSDSPSLPQMQGAYAEVGYALDSMAYRETASPTWSRGRIWFPKKVLDPENNYKGRFLPLAVLHELGHVLGNPEVPYTSMSEQFWYYAQLLDYFGFQHLSVDLFQSLYLGPVEEAAYHGAGVAPGPDGGQALAHVFSHLRGRDPTGKVTARIDGLALKLRDESPDPESSTDLVLDPAHVTVETRVPVFRVGSIHLYDSLELVPVTASPPSGGLTLQMSRNPSFDSCESPLRLEISEGGDFVPFFCASPSDLAN